MFIFLSQHFGNWELQVVGILGLPLFLILTDPNMLQLTAMLVGAPLGAVDQTTARMSMH
jgi:hypothetical protein